MPMARLTLDNPVTSISRFGILLAFQDELFRVADDRALTLIERMSMRALRHAEDTLLLSTDAAVAETSPAGLLNGLTAVGGGSPSNLQDQFLELWNEVSDGEPDRPYYILSARAAVWLASLHEDGAALVPNVSATTGGTIHGVPVIITKAAGNRVVLVDAANVAVVDEGVNVSRSEVAALEMLDNPTANSATPTGVTSVVSLFQANAVALKFVRWLHWTLLTDDAVAYLELPFDNSPN